MLNQLAAYLYNEPFIKQKRTAKSISLSINAAGTGGGIGLSSESQDISDVGATIEQMITQAGKNKYNILVSIDEVSKTPDMMVFASEFGKWLRAGFPVYMACTGLYENIEQVSNVKNLTFFRRAATVKTQPLNYIRMSEMYKSKLKIDSETAKKCPA